MSGKYLFFGSEGLWVKGGWGGPRACIRASVSRFLFAERTHSSRAVRPVAAVPSRLPAEPDPSNGVVMSVKINVVTLLTHPNTGPGPRSRGGRGGGGLSANICA